MNAGAWTFVFLLGVFMSNDFFLFFVFLGFALNFFSSTQQRFKHPKFCISACNTNEILMYLRRNSKTRAEVSFDEPLNIDWDGNELLLSDVLGTENDSTYKFVEEEIEKNPRARSARLRVAIRNEEIIP